MSKIIEGVEVLEIHFELNGVQRTIYPTLLHEKNDLILVDTGFQGQLPLFRSAFEKAGFSLEKLTSIVITHHDRDHIGGLPELQKLLGPKLEVLSHQVEKPYIEGDLLFDKKAPVGQADRKPDSAERSGTKVTRVLRDRERLPNLGGIVAVHTPGHTPGHLALFLERSGILITGDAINVVEGKLTGANPLHTHDVKAAAASLAKLSRFDVRGAISYHGGYLAGDLNPVIAELALAA